METLGYCGLLALLVLPALRHLAPKFLRDLFIALAILLGGVLVLVVPIVISVGISGLLDPRTGTVLVVAFLLYELLSAHCRHCQTPPR